MFTYRLLHMDTSVDQPVKKTNLHSPALCKHMQSLVDVPEMMPIRLDGSARGVMVIVVGNGHSDASSNHGPG